MRLVRENINLLKSKSNKEVNDIISKNPALQLSKNINDAIKFFIESIGIKFNEFISNDEFIDIINSVDGNVSNNSDKFKIKVTNFYFENHSNNQYRLELYGDLVNKIDNKMLIEDVYLASIYIKKLKN